MSELREDKALSDEEGEAKQKKRRHRLSRRSSIIKPKVWIGKTGVSRALVSQLNRQLKSDKLVKVKVQKTISATQEMRKISKEVASATNSSLIDVRGRTFTLWLDSKREKKEKSATSVTHARLRRFRYAARH